MDSKQALDTGRAGTILFVDDEPLSLKYFKASVGRYANVVTVDTTEAAMKILAAQGNEISVVVSDERMPRDSGVSFLSHVRKSWPSTVRILTSAYANIDLEQAINGAAIHRFVPKPWDLDELCQAMKEALQAEHISGFDALPEGPDAGPAQVSSDAHNASIELLAVLARELARPLASLETTAAQISALTGFQPMLTPALGRTPASRWADQHRVGKLASAADRIHRNVEVCKSLVEPITALSESLSHAAGTKSYSMAATASEVLDGLGRRASRGCIKLDARDDFLYRMPKPIIAFVLSNLLHDALSQIGDHRATISIVLAKGRDCNEIKITAEKERHQQDVSRDADRINRSALWAFGGELLFSSDNGAGTESAAIRLPRVHSDAAIPTH